MKKLFATLITILSLPASAIELDNIGSFSFQPITENVYVMHGPLSNPTRANKGFINNPAFVESKNGLIMIDPGGSYLAGKMVLDEVSKVSKKPILAVFNTHIHGDHWFGNHAVSESYPRATLYGHPKMISQANGKHGIFWLNLMSKLTEGSSDGTKVVAPTNPVDKGAEVVIDGQHFRIHHNGTAHTDTDIVIEHVESKTVFLGDNSFENRFGQFDSSSNMHGNIATLKYVKTLKADHFIPGHGKSGPATTSMDPFLNYLEKIREGVAAGFDEGLESYEIKEKILPEFEKYSQWSGFENNFGKHLNKMYLEHEALDMLAE